MPRKTRPAGGLERGARRFNEAAARCRGKRLMGAGMRLSTTRFNEAAARCRGKRTSVMSGRRSEISLQ